ncbi:hypothetical protein H8E77_44000 [bacterium]|nr:hypothetical protein [bacterium]
MNAERKDSGSYPVEPIREAFQPKKAQSWLYKIHPYYTRQPLNLVEEYIKYFCPKGGLVVDPFCGSGVTAAAALGNQRRALCMDIDPLAVFITRQTCISPVNIDEFINEFNRIKLSTEKCVTFTRTASEKDLDDHEISTWYPRKVKLPSNADRTYVNELFFKDNLIVLSSLLSEIRKIKSEGIKDQMLFAFSGILHRASLTFIEWKGSGGHSTIYQQYRYYVPKKPGKLDVWNLFERKCNSLIKIRETSNKIIGDFYQENETFSIHCDSAENLNSYVKKNSVDYIYTDPPYGAHISYLDLSTMYHAWLGLEVTENKRLEEAIQGGNLRFNEAHYLGILQKSFEQMFFALKEDAWLSLVFMHKSPNLWYSIRDMMRYIGFKYTNTVVQPLAWASWHKKTNPLRVLGGSLIVNFQKSSKRIIQTPMSLPIANVIKNVAERVIYRGGGATTEEILRDVVSDLFDNDLFFDVASKKIGDILSILESDFDSDDNDLWQIRSERKVGNFIPPKLRIQYYVIGYLRKVKQATFDEIVTNILPRLINGHKPSREDIADVLKEVAWSNDEIVWKLRDPKSMSIQIDLPLSIDKPDDVSYKIPESTTHNQHIYRLALLCRKAGYVPYIGKNERRDPMLAGMKPLTTLNINADPVDLKRIEQIDIIWATSDAVPVWAFEIEEHTSVLSAFERFISLLKVIDKLGENRRLTIVAPKSRHRKLNQELYKSSYVGHPLYLNNKMSFIYGDDLERNFKRMVSKTPFQDSDIWAICNFPDGD